MWMRTATTGSICVLGVTPHSLERPASIHSLCSSGRKAKYTKNSNIQASRVVGYCHSVQINWMLCKNKIMLQRPTTDWALTDTCSVISHFRSVSNSTSMCCCTQGGWWRKHRQGSEGRWSLFDSLQVQCQATFHQLELSCVKAQAAHERGHLCFTLCQLVNLHSVGQYYVIHCSLYFAVV